MSSQRTQLPLFFEMVLTQPPPDASCSLPAPAYCARQMRAGNEGPDVANVWPVLGSTDVSVYQAQPPLVAGIVNASLPAGSSTLATPGYGVELVHPNTTRVVMTLSFFVLARPY